MSPLPLSSDFSSVFPNKRIEIRPGIQLWRSAGVLPSRLTRRASITAPLVELAYSCKNTLYSELGRTSIEITPGYSHLGFHDAATGYSEYDCGDEVELYSLWITPDCFDDLCHAATGCDTLHFHTLRDDAHPYHHFRHDAREVRLLHEISTLLTDSDSGLNRLMLESHILQLLAINIAHLAGNSADDTVSICSRTDRERLQNARDILLERLDAPPTLHELSRMIQMNDCKMKRLFKQIYGQTVYQFIRTQRLEQAYELLARGDCNVSQAAFQVGYTNVSHFSDAFRKQFGILPHTLIH